MGVELSGTLSGTLVAGYLESSFDFRQARPQTECTNREYPFHVSQRHQDETNSISNKWGDRFWLFQPNKSQATTRNNQGDTLGDNESPNLWGKPNKSTRQKGDNRNIKWPKRRKHWNQLSRRWSGTKGNKGLLRRRTPNSTAGDVPFSHQLWCWAPAGEPLSIPVPTL